MNPLSTNPADPTAESETTPAPALSAAPALETATIPQRCWTPETAFGSPRDFMDNRFVYVVLSSRAKGLSIGVNLNPDRRCNLNCVYCEVDRTAPQREPCVDVEVMAAELMRTLAFVHSGQLRSRLPYAHLPPELTVPRHVALSGDGEPTLCPHFSAALEAIIHARALGKFPFFKIVLLTNGTGLGNHQVQQSLRSLTKQDEVWIKLDAGTNEQFNAINRPQPGVTLETVLSNILTIGRRRAVVIQSLFASLGGLEPDSEDIEQYARRLKELKNAGACISSVQIYSAVRPAAGNQCSHLPLRVLSRIAHLVHSQTGLPVEVF
jgi:wyosine [tRNA(Phe)-imidazoG37] synthetase (radical SAM superfamily)